MPKSPNSIHDPRYVEVVARLRAARIRQGISQSELGRRTGRDQAFVSKVERCERRLDILELMLLCRALGIPLAAVTPTEFEDVLRG